MLISYLVLVLVLTLSKETAIFVTTFIAELGLGKHLLVDRDALQLVPFAMGSGSVGSFLYNLVGNFLLFLPLGGLIYLNLGSIRRKALFAVLLCAGMSFVIEFIQFFLERDADINDLIFNAVGAIAGVWAVRHIPISDEHEGNDHCLAK